MECNFYDKHLNKIGALSSFASMAWEEGYADKGSFTLVAEKDNDTAEWLKVGNFVGVRPHKTLMWIYTTEEKGGQIWAYGAEAKWLLNSRIFDGKAICKNVETSLKDAIMAKRPFSFLDVADSRNLTGEISSQRSYNTLFNLSKTWCDMVGYGFTLLHDKARKKLLYDVYKGQEKPNAVFAEKYGNLYNIVQTISQKAWANVAFVGGAGEGEDRIFVTVGDTEATDLDRSEIFVDARDLQQEEGQSASDYKKLLTNRGLEALSKAAITNEIDFEIAPDDYGSVFSLGDKITVILSKNVKAFIPVVGVKFLYEENQKKVSLVLGSPVLKSEV